MAWCEANRVDYVFGVARSASLEKVIVAELITATIKSIRTGKDSPLLQGLQLRHVGQLEPGTSCRRQGGGHRRRCQSSLCGYLAHVEAKPRHLYETVYCARGEMENRIKECQLDLFADRASAATMQANQLRL
jgi:hypothetical protein